MSLNDSLVEFRSNIAKVDNYINLAFEQDDASNNVRNAEEIEFIVSSAFLKLFIAWEGFLEKSFISYLTGELSLDGGILTKYANPIDTSHAHKIIIGTQKYVDWSNIEIVNRISSLFFENAQPYTSVLNSIARELSELRTIRNAAAHTSSTTQRQLDAVASRIFSRTVSNIRVADFITSISPEDNTKTILQIYQLKLTISAENIAHNRI